MPNSAAQSRAVFPSTLTVSDFFDMPICPGLSDVSRPGRFDCTYRQTAGSTPVSMLWKEC